LRDFSQPGTGVNPNPPAISTPNYICEGVVPDISTFCVSLFIEPLVDGFPGAQLQPVANPFARQGCFPSQTPRQVHLHRIAFAAVQNGVGEKTGFGRAGLSISAP
jgi:hypothetical protein